MESQERSIEVTIDGMHCSHCALGIERHLKSKGLDNVTVSFGSASATFTPKEGFDLSWLGTEIQKLGYKIRGKNSAYNTGFLATVESKFIFSLIWTLPLFLHTFIDIPLVHNPYVQLALCTPVFILGLAHFGRSALFSLKRKFANMDVLIVLGITAAFIYSLVGTFLSLGDNFLFYETTATITTIVLLGNLLEARSVRRTTSAIEDLAAIQAKKAKRLIRRDGREEIQEIDLDQINIGDELLVNTGDKVPTDGVIIWGEVSIDQSMITGESVPVDKGAGAQVIGGTVVQKGSVKLRATAVGENTFLAGMIRLVKGALKEKPQIQRVGDEVSAVFVPVVVLIALATFFLANFAFDVSFGNALLRAIAVLVIACPCAMGLATPTAVSVGIGQAAKHGILIKGGDTLERFSKIKKIIFDKTGTLTTGEFQIKNLEAFDRPLEFVKSIMAALERHSSHPIAISLLKAFGPCPAIELHDVQEERGVGIRGKDSNGDLFEICSFPRVRELVPGVAHDIYLLENGKIVASLDIYDFLKPNTKIVIDALRSMQIEPILLSGDSQSKCASVGKQLGITEIYAEKLPHEKLEIIRKFEEKSPTAFVGDGVNDAPALSRAAVGVSLSDATEVAIHSAHVVLLKGEFSRLIQALRISKRTLSIIKQNLFWAFLYNVLAIPFAAIGYLSPTIACFAMAGSDVVVVLNSLRLRSSSR